MPHRELLNVQLDGVEVWACSMCEWAHPDSGQKPPVSKRRDELLKAFARHECSDHPPAQIAGE
ncbi:MAG: hypothetical protein WB608_05115 [Terracidiphilus sp.]